MVRSRHRIDYHSSSWKLHRRVSFTFWYLVAGYVAFWQIRGMEHGTWPLRNGLVVLACLLILVFPYKVQGGHLITYRHVRWLLFPVCLLNIPLYVVGVIPQSRLVNWGEMRLRHLFHFHNELPGSLIAMATLGLAPLWLALIVGRAVGL
jgi:hypothetical protein